MATGSKSKQHHCVSRSGWDRQSVLTASEEHTCVGEQHSAGQDRAGVRSLRLVEFFCVWLLSGDCCDYGLGVDDAECVAMDTASSSPFR